jgi:DNA (cytosine-5)-methyltransferase 3A
MNVLSLFDGMSCGRIALEKAGIEVNKYFAAEVDKYAMQVSAANYPEIVQLGDVQFITKNTFGSYKIDLLIGGSPCQGFSMAGKQLNFEDPRSKLFFDYVRLLRDLKPKYFLLENVKMKKESQAIISEYMGCEPIEINSALVSAQNRKRLYWTNIPGIEQPEDRGILLKDILEDGSEKVGASRGRYIVDGKRADHKVDSMAGKTEQRIEVREDNKSNCLTTVGKDNLVIKEATKKGYAIAEEGDGVDLSFPNSKTRRGRVNKGKAHSLMGGTPQHGAIIKVGNVNPSGKGMNGNVFSSEGKSPTLTTNKGEGIKMGDSTLEFRKLTPLECERLQTVPDNYTNHVSNSQRYKMLGNGWTIDVISHIMSKME